MSEENTKKLSSSEILHMAADIVSAYVSYNQVQAIHVPDLIKSVVTTLSEQQDGGKAEVADLE